MVRERLDIVSINLQRKTLFKYWQTATEKYGVRSSWWYLIILVQSFTFLGYWVIVSINVDFLNSFVYLQFRLKMELIRQKKKLFNLNEASRTHLGSYFSQIQICSQWSLLRTGGNFYEHRYWQQLDELFFVESPRLLPVYPIFLHHQLINSDLTLDSCKFRTFIFHCNNSRLVDAEKKISAK